MDNLLEPKLFDTEMAARKYAAKHTCAFCLGRLVCHFAPNRKYKLVCECGDFCEYQAARISAAEKVERHRRKADKKLSPSQEHVVNDRNALKGLGY